jgi:hypothetical protein
VSVTIALLLLWVVSPVAMTMGYLQVAIPSQLFGLSARLYRRGLRAVGLESSVVTWPNTPLQRRLFGDPATALGRACERPEEFRLVVLGIRLTGILLIVLSLSAAVIGALLLATD